MEGISHPLPLDKATLVGHQGNNGKEAGIQYVLKHLHGMAQQPDWAIIAALFNVTLAFPDGYSDAGCSGLGHCSFSRNFAKQFCQHPCAMISKEFPRLVWNVVWPRCFAVLHLLDCMIDFTIGDGGNGARNRIY